MKSKIILAAVATVAIAVSVVLGINLVNMTNKFDALFNYHSAVCEYERYENESILGEDFPYLITCSEATQYELDDYIECSNDKGSYCTVDDLI